MASGAVFASLVRIETHGANEETSLQERARRDGDAALVPCRHHPERKHRHEQERPGCEPTSVDLPAQRSSAEEPPRRDKESVFDEVRCGEGREQPREACMAHVFGHARSRRRAQEPDVFEGFVMETLFDHVRAYLSRKRHSFEKCVDFCGNVAFDVLLECLPDALSRKRMDAGIFVEHTEATAGSAHHEQESVVRDANDGGPGSREESVELRVRQAQRLRFYAEPCRRGVEPLMKLFGVFFGWGCVRRVIDMRDMQDVPAETRFPGERVQSLESA